jgi:hypothetical protein
MMGLRPSILRIEIGLQNYGFFRKKRRNLPKNSREGQNYSFFPVQRSKSTLIRLLPGRLWLAPPIPLGVRPLISGKTQPLSSSPCQWVLDHKFFQRTRRTASGGLVILM